MKILKNVKIGGKLLLIAAPLIIVGIVALVCAFVSVQKTEAQLTDVFYDKLYEINNNLLAADRDFYQSHVGATGYYDMIHLDTGLPEETLNMLKDSYMSDYKKNKQQVYDNSAKSFSIAKEVESLYTGTAIDGVTFKSAYEKLQADLAAWEAIFNVETQTGDWSGFNSTFDTARDNIDIMQDITAEWAAKEKAAVHKSVMSMLTTLIVTFAIIMVLLLGLTILVILGITGPIKQVSAQLGEIADGNLGVVLPDDSQIGKDELGEMQRSTKNLVDKLVGVIGRTKQAAQEVDSQSEDLADSSVQATTTSSQVTEAVCEVSRGAVSQAESVEKAAGDTSEMGNNIEDISASVESMDTFAGEMKNSCDKAMSALNRLIKQSESVTASVKEIGDTINSTNNSSKEISQFTQAISDIASQTNLLSLNASIEAARAGEAGRGFAVVADEIRQLADQSADSADKIKAVVEKLLSDSQSSIEVLERLNTSFNEQAEQLDVTKSDMEGMLANVDNVSATSDEINNRVKALEEAKNGLTEIISDLSAISEENAASTEETNASMQELNATFTLISDSAEKLQNLSKEMAEAISYFHE